MLIHLKKGERIYVNGAVLRFDRRTSLEFLNDVSFLLEDYVMQVEEAATPLQQLYLTIQTILIDPLSATLSRELYKHLFHNLRISAGSAREALMLDEVDAQVSQERYFGALKILRRGMTRIPGTEGAPMPGTDQPRSD